MTPGEHYAEAERLLALVAKFGGDDTYPHAEVTAEAQAHATLATCTQIPVHMVTINGNVSDDDARKIRDAVRNLDKRDGRSL